MPRFFVDPSAVEGDMIRLDEADIRHIRVLRLGPEEQFFVCDGRGRDYLCTLGADGLAEIRRELPSRGEPDVGCTVYAAFSKGERMDYTVQKSVELGAAAVCLFPAARCVVKYDAGALEKKLLRWGKIAQEAAKQSGRGIIPPVLALADYRSAIRAAAGSDGPLFFYEDETRLTLRAALEGKPGARSIGLVTGPEGGFAPEEVDQARRAGLPVITLGPRILRCETAPVAALAAVMYHTGNL